MPKSYNFQIFLLAPHFFNSKNLQGIAGKQIVAKPKTTDDTVWLITRRCQQMTLCGLLQGGVSGKEYTCQCRRRGFGHCVRKIPWSGKWQPTLVFLPGESHGQRSLVGYCLWVAESQKWLSTRVHWWNYVGQIRDLIIVGKRNVSSIQTIVITAYWYVFLL